MLSSTSFKLGSSILSKLPKGSSHKILGGIASNYARPRYAEFHSMKGENNATKIQNAKREMSRWERKSFFSTQTSTVKEDPAMFCFQCEQTRDGKGCTTIGVCGKTPETATLQDLLMYQLGGISMYAVRAKDLGMNDPDMDAWTLNAIFSTITNVNFDSERFGVYLQEAQTYFQKAKNLYLQGCKKKGITPEALPDADYSLKGLDTLEKLEARGHEIGILQRRAKYGEDLVGLQEMITYGIKGMCAYADHAHTLGRQNDEVFRFVYQVLDDLAHKNLSVDQLLGLAMKVGEVNLKVMSMLESGHIDTFGTPTPHKVRISAKKGKAILISGHDIKDLAELLKQTEGTGINVYTHGEMLPAHAYPELHKYSHLAGNYGGPWQLQKVEFAAFPGPVVMTSNCLIEPRKSYFDRVFTRHSVGWPGVKHINDYDYSEVIETAKSMKGFEKDEPEKFIESVGYGKSTVLSIADKVIAAIKAKQVNHFFFIGGCDGSEGERNYFKELAIATPEDSVILTAGCGKYRFNRLKFGDIGGIPRVLDMGQCNDAYGAIQVALALANAFKTDVNGLPLSFAVSWFEQKAVAVLLSLLHLGVQNIRLGPNLPGFCTPNMIEILQKKFNLKTINPNIPQEVKEMLAGR